MRPAQDCGVDRSLGRSLGHKGRAAVGPRRAMAGGTLAGFLIGLLCGLTIAVVAAVFVTRSPVPFVNKTAHAPDRVVEPLPGAEVPDPNKPLYSKNRPAIAGQPPGAVPAPAQPAEPERGSILERLFGRSGEPAPVTPSTSAPEPAKGSARAPDPSAGAAKAPEASGGYLLQAGAFRSRSDADAMRGRLALVGFEAQVVTAEVNGQTMHRVRVGPYAQLDEVNKVRSRLAENGIEASVVRQR